MEEGKVKEIEKQKIHIAEQISKLKELNKQCDEEMRKAKINEKKLKESYCSGGNKLMRVSVDFSKQFTLIDEKRELVDLEEISNPKKTELIFRHKLWPTIKSDIINFNTEIEKNVR